MGITILAVTGLFLFFTVGLQVLARRRANALVNTHVTLPGAVGHTISNQPHALVYFFTPQCGACRSITPRMQARALAGAPVFPIDCTQTPDLAQALNVMATPTTIEFANGTVMAVHIGPVPLALWEKFGPTAQSQ